jgi:phospholipase C
MYDHVRPPMVPSPPGSFPTLGVRVPALVVSPWIPARTACHIRLDHTSVIKTILRRFLPATPPSFGPRVDNAFDLEPLLTCGEARTDTPMRLTPPAQAKAVAPPQSDPIAADDDWRGSLRDLRAIVDARRPRVGG